jgi:hypothetical protein
MITLHDWIGEERNLLSEFEQSWQENDRRSYPLEGIRWGTRRLPDYRFWTDFALG